MLAHNLSASSLSSIDPYSDELPPIDVLPLLSRQPRFHRPITSFTSLTPQPVSVHHHSRSSASSMSCAASYLSSSPSYGCPTLPQQSVVGLSLLRSSRSVDSLQHHPAPYKQSSSVSSASALASLHHTQPRLREWQQSGEERKEVDDSLPHEYEYEHKEQQQQQQQHQQPRIREVSHTPSPQSQRQWRRERSND